MTTDSPALVVSGLTVQYAGASSTAIDGLSFQLDAGEQVALIGRSGSGKSTVASALMGLLPASSQVTGQLHLAGMTLNYSEPSAWSEVRGSKLALIGQESQSGLNPVRRIQSQFVEVLRRHHPSCSRETLVVRMRDWLQQVGIDTSVAQQYPHQLSGGMRQRVLIAMALSCEPMVLIADEPSSGQDVDNQRQLLGLMSNLCERHGSSLLLISHDLNLVASNCSRILVMADGRLVESAAVGVRLDQLSHADSKLLIDAARRLEDFG